MLPLTEAWQNQRHYGITWRSPALLERAHWSTSEGAQLTFESGQSPKRCPDSWEVAVTISTDADGWQYASVFKHFDYPREGGRASQRATDFVRRRLWRKKAEASENGTTKHKQAAARADAEGQTAAALTEALISPTTTMFGARVRKQTETERRKSVVRIFIGMFAGCIRRHQIWNVVPWDPGAWWVMYNQHQAALLELQQSNMHCQIDLKALSEPTDQSQPKSEDRLGEEDEEQRPSLVRELLCAAVHSRAAYGYAMAAGHMSNLLNFALMHTVHQISFDVAGGASAEANNTAVAQLAGLEPADVIMGEWSNSVMRPCHYVAADKANHCIILAIRGSLEVGDVLSDLSANPMELNLLGVQGKVHEGMMSAATFVHCNTAAALQSAAESYPGWPLVVTGHSMGGGVAAIVAALLRDGTAPEGLGPVRCCVISPAAVFSGPLSEACRPFITSLILRSDAVPRLSYASVEGIFVELVGASPVRRAASDVKHRIEQLMSAFKIDWVFKKPNRAGQLVHDDPQGLNAVLPLLDDEEAVDIASHAAVQAFMESSPQKSKVLKVDQADSPQQRSRSMESNQGVVDAAQFAESMVPEGLLGPALPRNPSQTSLSGAAPGGVLEAGLHPTALPKNPSQTSLAGAAVGGAREVGLHPVALSPRPLTNVLLPEQASGRNTDGTKLPGYADKPATGRSHGATSSQDMHGTSDEAVSTSSSEGDLSVAEGPSGQAQKRKAGGSSFFWPSIPFWSKGKSRDQQKEPDQSASGNQSHPQDLPDDLGSADQAAAACNKDDDAIMTSLDHPDDPSDQAAHLADAAMDRISAAQQAMSSSPSNAAHALHAMRPLSNHQHDFEPTPALQPTSNSTSDRVFRQSISSKAPLASPRKAANGKAVKVLRSPQHNSRLTGSHATSLPRQTAGPDSTQPHSSGNEHSSIAQAAGQLLGQIQQQGLDAGQGSVAQPLAQGRADSAEGPEHAGNPGSQAAARSQCVQGNAEGSQTEQRMQEGVADMLGVTRLEPDGPPTPLYPPGRIIWMLPSPDQPSSEDAHIPVADPEQAMHPEDDPSSSSAAAASFSIDGQEQNPSSSSAADLSSSAAAVSEADTSAVSPEEEVQKLWQKQPILLDVQKECFSRLLLLPEILVDHLPDTYLAAVQQL